MTHGPSRILVLKIRGRRTNLFLLAWEISRGLLLHKGFKDKAMAIKAKAKSGLLASQSRGHVSIATSLDT